MTELVSAPAGSSGYPRMQASPGWDLELGVQEQVGATDEQLDELLRAELMQALLQDDTWLDVYKRIAGQLLQSDALVKTAQRSVGDQVTPADLLLTHLLQQLNMQESLQFDAGNAYVLAKLLEDMFGVQDVLRKELSKTLPDQLAMEAYFAFGAQTEHDEVQLDETATAKFVKLLKSELVYNDAFTRKASKLLVESMLLADSLSAVVLTLLQDVDSGSGSEYEHLLVRQNVQETLWFLHELSVSMSKTVQTDTVWFDVAVAHMLRVLDESVSVADLLRMNVHRLFASFELDDGLVVRMSIRSRSNSHTAGRTESSGEHTASSGADSDNTGSAAVGSDVVTRSGSDSKVLTNTIVRF